VDPRAGVDHAEKRNFLTLPGLELRTLGHPARSHSLYVAYKNMKLINLADDFRVFLGGGGGTR
jgi:hypothetical protein